VIRTWLTWLIRTWLIRLIEMWLIGMWLWSKEWVLANMPKVTRSASHSDRF
jgi:hypothetical protein